MKTWKKQYGTDISRIKRRYHYESFPTIVNRGNRYLKKITAILVVNRYKTDTNVAIQRRYGFRFVSYLIE